MTDKLSLIATQLVLYLLMQRNAFFESTLNELPYIQIKQYIIHLPPIVGSLKTEPNELKDGFMGM